MPSSKVGPVSLSGKPMVANPVGPAGPGDLLIAIIKNIAAITITKKKKKRIKK